MARTALTPTLITIAGITPSQTPGTVDGHFFANSPTSAPYGNHFALVSNVGAAPRTITFQTGATLEGQGVDDVAVVIPDGESRLIGPFTPRLFNRASTEPTDPLTVYIDYDAGNESDLTIEIYEFPVT